VAQHFMQVRLRTRMSVPDQHGLDRRRHGVHHRQHGIDHGASQATALEKQRNRGHDVVRHAALHAHTHTQYPRPYTIT
jgi:hypothetical protein